MLAETVVRKGAGGKFARNGVSGITKAVDRSTSVYDDYSFPLSSLCSVES